MIVKAKKKDVVSKGLRVCIEKAPFTSNLVVTVFSKGAKILGDLQDSSFPIPCWGEVEKEDDEFLYIRV